MQKAYELMQPVEARIKHIIMLADGSDCDEQEGCLEIAARMQKQKITFSTVSFGLGPHTAFLERVAHVGGGNFYLATRANDLPRIFTKDAMLASKSLLVEEPFKPKADPSAEILRGLDLDSMPPLLGYVATSPKPLASLPLETHKDDPLLATWRYGLGRSVAFTSDAQARWAAHWLGWSGYGKFWSQAVRWMLMRSRPTNWQTTVEEDRGIGRVTVEVMDDQGGFVNFLDLDAHIVGPDLKVETLRLEQAAPGRYTQEFPVRDVGAYLVTVSRQSETERKSQTAGILVPYPPEYRDLKPNEFLLTQLADTSGGHVDPPPESIYGGQREAARYPEEVWILLVSFAAMLLVADVAVRRIVIETSQVTGAARRVQDQIGRVWAGLRGEGRVKPVHEPTLGRLLGGRKKRRAEEPTRSTGGISEQPLLPSDKAHDAEEAQPPIDVSPTAPAAPPEQETAGAEPAEQPTDALSRLKAAKRRARRGKT